MDNKQQVLEKYPNAFCKYVSMNGKKKVVVLLDKNLPLTEQLTQILQTASDSEDKAWQKAYDARIKPYDDILNELKTKPIVGK